MKNRETSNGASKKASAGGRKDGKGKVGEFSVLPKSAGIKQHMAYMLLHLGAITRSVRVDLGSSWCLGYELTRIKAKLKLTGKDWDDHCVKVVGKTSRQARDYMVLAKAFGSAKEMIENLEKSKEGKNEKVLISFANAVVIARARFNPEPTPEPEPDDTGEENATENEPVTIKPQADETGLTTGDRKPPAAGSTGAVMLAEILRIASNLADDLALLGRVHAILVKAEASAERDAATDMGCGESKGKAKSRKPATKKKRGKAA